MSWVRIKSFIMFWHHSKKCSNFHLLPRFLNAELCNINAGSALYTLIDKKFSNNKSTVFHTNKWRNKDSHDMYEANSSTTTTMIAIIAMYQYDNNSNSKATIPALSIRKTTWTCKISRIWWQYRYRKVINRGYTKYASEENNHLL